MKNVNPAPKLERSWLEVELKPSNPNQIAFKKVDEFQKKLAEICDMHIFCGPMIISPDSDNNLLPYYTNPKFKPRDWNAYTWWTRKDAKNVMTILDHSHESFYYYPENNLIDISIATCNTYDLDVVLKFIHDYWKPNSEGIRYAFLHPNNSDCKWAIYPS